MRLAWQLCKLLDSKGLRLGIPCTGDLFLSLPFGVDSRGGPLVAGPRVPSTVMLRIRVPDTLRPGSMGCTTFWGLQPSGFLAPGASEWAPLQAWLPWRPTG